MRRLLRAFSILCALGAPATALAEDALPVVRLEIRPIASMTLSDSQFLKGEAGSPVTVAGELRLPAAPGKLPAVVLIHGSGGPGANIPMWEGVLNGAGVAPVALDGFSGRGIVQTNDNQALLGRLNLILDAYAALDMLAKHPRIDPDRIVLMGFSRGGQATLYAAMKRFHETWNRSGAQFAAYIPFYPDCMTRYQRDEQTVGKPVRMFHGAPDDYNPAAPCASYMERAKAAGADMTQTLYPDAHHAFDTPIPAAPVVAKTSQTVRKCRIVERDPGALIDEATNATFAYTDPCVETGPQVGGNDAARAASIAAVKDFLATKVAATKPK